MFELSEERLLMISSDNSVKLTTHRIIHESSKGRQQIMLEDFESYQLICTSVGYYGSLLFIIIAIFLLIASNSIIRYGSITSFLKSDPNLLIYLLKDPGVLISLTVIMIVYFFYLISRRYFIKINGKYNSIEIRVTSFRNRSIKKMLDALVEQSNKIKQEAKKYQASTSQ